VNEATSDTPACTLGVDIGGTKIAIAVANADGDIVRRDGLPTQDQGGAEGAILRAIDAGKRLLAKHDGALQGVGVATMGVTLEDRVLLAPAVAGWEKLAIPATFRHAFPGTPIRIENDVNAATFAEMRWGALHGVDTGIYLNLGTGIAAGLVVGGRILRGAHGAAGEIGFNPRTPHDELGAATGHVPLEEWAGGRGLAARANQQLGLTVEELFANYDRDTAARELVDGTLQEIAFHLANLAIAMDPSRIVLGAGTMRAGDLVLETLRRRIIPFMPFPIEVVPARFTLDAALIGAVALALEPMPAL
jgi:glucokinase